ncbi:MAG: helix-turn-helix transcriptional regulator [Propionibacteriaceae bacterium]|jgi:DNA-binding PadR family transcriptional regulator|nr:helix-turn-helix transcriptional regulator [Propionibacteriaceae bacterium]
MGPGESALTEAAYYILLSLYTPLHGYGIMQNVADISHGRVDLGAGTLYGALGTLVKKGWIVETDQHDRKREYLITAKGRAVVDAEILRLEELVENGHRVVKGSLDG